MTPTEITEAIRELAKTIEANVKAIDVVWIESNSDVIKKANEKIIELIEMYPKL